MHFGLIFDLKSSVRFSNLNFQVEVVVTIVSEFDSGEKNQIDLLGIKLSSMAAAMINVNNFD